MGSSLSVEFLRCRCLVQFGKEVGSNWQWLKSAEEGARRGRDGSLSVVECLRCGVGVGLGVEVGFHRQQLRLA